MVAFYRCPSLYMRLDILLGFGMNSPGQIETSLLQLLRKISDVDSLKKMSMRSSLSECIYKQNIIIILIPVGKNNIYIQKNHIVLTFQILKDILPHNENFLQYFFIVLFTCLFIKTQHLHIFGRLKQFFNCFYHSIFVARFCYLVEYPIHAFNEQVKYCLFLQCYDMLVEKTKEVMYQKCHRALLADLI